MQIEIEHEEERYGESLENDDHGKVHQGYEEDYVDCDMWTLERLELFRNAMSLPVFHELILSGPQ